MHLGMFVAKQKPLEQKAKLSMNYETMTVEPSLL